MGGKIKAPPSLKRKKCRGFVYRATITLASKWLLNFVFARSILAVLRSVVGARLAPPFTDLFAIVDFNRTKPPNKTTEKILVSVVPLIKSAVI